MADAVAAAATTGAAPGMRGRDAAPADVALPAAARGWCLATAATCLLPLLLQVDPTGIAVGIAVVGVVVGLSAMRGRLLPTLLRVALAVALVGVVLASTRFSIGRDTGCALLAAMLALKPVELCNLRDARSLVGFALFAPFATFLLDQGPLSLLLGVIGAATGLVAMQRLAELDVPGEAIPADATPTAIAPWRRFLGVGRLVAIGLPLAMVVFWLFPRIDSPLWGVPERAVARPGLSGEMSPGDWLDIVGDDRVALRVTFDGPVPPEAQRYWRGPVLWDFDGRSWRQSDWMSSLPPGAIGDAATGGGARAYDYEIEIEATDRIQLIGLDVPTTVPDRVRMAGDRSLVAPRPLTTATRWRMLSIASPAVFEPELRPFQRTAGLRLPEGFNPRARALAAQWRREAGSDDGAVVDRALAAIRAEFGYTLDTPLPGRHSVDEFWFDQKRGYCEHFSSSFVFLMRAAGVPARVVTGYSGGYRNPYGGYLQVRRADAHAWAEVWLPRRGWVRVDPTAAVAPERVYDTIEDRFGGGAAGGFAPVIDAGDWLRRGWNDFVLGFDATRQRQLLRPMGGGDLDTGQLGMIFAVLATLALAAMVWLVLRGERERDPVLRAWRAMTGRYARAGLDRAGHEPASDWAARVVAARPDLADALLPLTTRFERWRYARGGAGDDDARALARALRAHRPTTATPLPRSRR